MADQTHAQIVRFVNRIREDHGHGPITVMPKGRRKAVDACPIANALKDIGHVVVVQTIWIGNEETVDIPPYVSNWIDRFDDAKYPELIAA